MKIYKQGDAVKFRLDGCWEGSGVIKDLGRNANVQVGFVVTLDKPVKEWPAGEDLLVWRDEMIDD